ncbi:MAG: single-stranded DNA-binding protein [Burkholderiales bacterium]
MIRIEVISTTVDERSGNKNGRNWVIREQAAYAHLLDEFSKPLKYPVACLVPLEKEAPPYQAGFYTLDLRSVYVGEFRRLELGRVKLVPAGAAAKAA